MTSPLVQFVIGGVQKAGTTALASFLQGHSDIVLPLDKEAHVFDSPDFDEAWSCEQINRVYASRFGDCGDAHRTALHGDATPIYVMHRKLVQRIARYNPEMRWIILLRHPVDRAISHYHMERRRGDENRSIWLALLSERWRLRGHEDDFSVGSPLRHHSYRLRGDYARHLDALYEFFPQEQVFLLSSDRLRRSPAAALAEICSFLGLSAPSQDADYGTVFAGEYVRWSERSLQRRLLCWWWRRQLSAQRRYGLDWK